MNWIGSVKRETRRSPVNEITVAQRGLCTRFQRIKEGKKKKELECLDKIQLYIRRGSIDGVSAANTGRNEREKGISRFQGAYGKREIARSCVGGDARKSTVAAAIPFRETVSRSSHRQTGSLMEREYERIDLRLH